MIKITATSDLHGNLPEIIETDILLIGGDILPVTNHEIYFQQWWLDNVFRKWLKNIPAKKIIGVAGNHDLIMEWHPHLIPKNLSWTYLQDSGTTYKELNIWGSPWQPVFGYNWAFNLNEEELEKKWELIPNNTDILVLHGPPYEYGDEVQDERNHVGSISLTNKIKKIKPKLVIAGHIHGAKGVYQIPELPDTIIANVSLVNEQYIPMNRPFVFEI